MKQQRRVLHFWCEQDARWYYTIESSIYAAADQYVTFGPFLTCALAAEAIRRDARRCWLQHDWLALDPAGPLRAAVTRALEPMTWFVRDRVPMRQRDRLCRRCGQLRRTLSDALEAFLDDLPIFSTSEAERRVAIWHVAPPQIGLNLHD